MAFTYTHDFRFKAAPEDVFTALTDEGALRSWFADKVDVGTEVGGPFRFWGRRTLRAPTARRATQKLVRLEPPTHLAFSWRLAGGEGIFKPDFTAEAPVIELERLVAQPRARVFQALVDPTIVAKWCHAPGARIEPRVGGEYYLGWSFEYEGRRVECGTEGVRAIEQDRLLEVGWLDWRGDPEVTGQFIRFTLEDAPEGTLVRFVHGGFTRTADLSDYPWGWRKFLGQLADASAGKFPPPPGRRAHSIQVRPVSAIRHSFRDATQRTV